MKIVRKERGNVWLAVGGIVINEQDEWLVVKKKYGGLKGKWSVPAGFLNEGETIATAVMREVKEETGIDTMIKGIVGVRTGVIEGIVSDNLLFFLLSPISTTISIQENELDDVKFMTRQELLISNDSSELLRKMVSKIIPTPLVPTYGLNPGDQFGYTEYVIFF